MSALPADLERFISRVRDAATGRQETAAADAGIVLQQGAPITVARAPGRLDLMGGIADYSGSLVLQWPIRESTRVAVQFQPSMRVLRVVSVSPANGRDGAGNALRPCESHRMVDVPLALITGARPPYADLRNWFSEDDARHWAAYVGGVFAVLHAEQGVQFPGGGLVVVESNVPEGKGVSSSAALETSTMAAVAGALHLPLAPREMAMLCQRAENLVVGAPCGVMDQMASMMGVPGALMALLCQPAELKGMLPLPGHLGVWGIDSGIRHAVTGADYASVRVGAFMGYRVLAGLAGLQVEPGDRPGHVRVRDPRWHGYLVNVGIEEFQRLEGDLPDTLSGREFLERYGGTTDPVTTVQPERTYAVRVPTAHPIYEHARVVEWARLLGDANLNGDGHPGGSMATSPAPADVDAARLGELMYHSHASYTACGLGSDGTDLLVQLAREAGEAEGIYGAKITGGGSGGTVALLADSGAGGRVRQIAADYESRTGRRAHVFEGSSPGAAVVGAVTVKAH